MNTKLTVTVNNSVSGGLYDAKFIGIEETTHPEYGAGLEWQWEIVKGRSNGQRVTRRTGRDPTPRNSCGKIISGLLGRELKDGEEIDPQAFTGADCKVFVVQTDAGWPRVESVTCV